MIEDVSAGFLNIVIEAFLTEIPFRLASLRFALARGDTTALHEQALSLRSAGTFIGIGRFTGLCRELAALTSVGSSVGADELLSEIEAEYVRVQQDLKHR